VGGCGKEMEERERDGREGVRVERWVGGEREDEDGHCKYSKLHKPNKQIRKSNQTGTVIVISALPVATAHGYNNRAASACH
jgi:hypothetical protein